MKKLISRLNWRQILIHFVATWFFMHAFQTLATLHDTRLLQILRHTDEGNIPEVLKKSGITTSDLIHFTLWTSIGNAVGLLVAFALSLTISIKSGWYWVNSLIVLLAAYLLAWFGLLGWDSLKGILLLPGQLARNTTHEFLINGTILLLLGILTFFLTLSNKFINSKNFAAS